MVTIIPWPPEMSMLADLEAHRQLVMEWLGTHRTQEWDLLLARQQQLRVALAHSLEPPRFMAFTDLAGAYDIGLPLELLERYQIRVVGGAVRDRLLGVSQSPDIDCVVPAEFWQDFLDHVDACGYRPRISAHALACKLQQGPATGREFVATRSDSYLPGGRLKQAAPAPLASDPWRRDFTIQALYADPRSGELWDPFAAAAQPCLRAVMPGTLTEDPLRVVRLVRAHVTHGLQIDEPTKLEAQAVASSELALWVESHRVRAELDRAARCGVLGGLLRTLARWHWPRIVEPDPSHDRLTARSATQWLRRAGLPAYA